MISDGLRYYLSRDIPNGRPAPRELFVAVPAARAGTLYPVLCRHPAACLGAEPRIWIIGGGHEKSPYRAVTHAQAAVLRPRYHLRQVRYVRGLTIFLLTRAR
jgi:mannosyltransferase